MQAEVKRNGNNTNTGIAGLALALILETAKEF
jgi:hypothetical protein